MSRSRGGRSLTTRSPISMSPLVTDSSPAIIRSAVVLPQPDGPTRHMNSPWATSRLTESSESAPLPAYCLVSSLRVTLDIGPHSFDGTREDASDEVTLEGEEDNQRDEDGHHGTGGHDPVVRRQRAGLVVQEDSERRVHVATEEHQRDQQVVPHPDELEYRQRRDRGKGEGQPDAIKDLPLPRAFDAPPFKEALGVAGKEVAHEKDAKRQSKGDVEDDDAGDRPVGIEPEEVAHLAIELNDGDQRHLERNDHEAHDHQEDHVSTAPRAEHEAVGRQARNQSDQNRHGNRDFERGDEGVQHAARMEPLGKDRGVVVQGELGRSGENPPPARLAKERLRTQ